MPCNFSTQSAPIFCATFHYFQLDAWRSSSKVKETT